METSDSQGISVELLVFVLFSVTDSSGAWRLKIAGKVRTRSGIAVFSLAAAVCETMVVTPEGKESLLFGEITFAGGGMKVGTDFASLIATDSASEVEVVAVLALVITGVITLTGSNTSTDGRSFGTVASVNSWSDAASSDDILKSSASVNGVGTGCVSLGVRSFAPVSWILSTEAPGYLSTALLFEFPGPCLS